MICGTNWTLSLWYYCYYCYGGCCCFCLLAVSKTPWNKSRKMRRKKLGKCKNSFQEEKLNSIFIWSRWRHRKNMQRLWPFTKSLHFGKFSSQCPDPPIKYSGKGLSWRKHFRLDSHGRKWPLRWDLNKGQLTGFLRGESSRQKNLFQSTCSQVLG